MNLQHKNKKEQDTHGRIADGLPRHSVTRRNRLRPNAGASPILSDSDVEFSREFFVDKEQQHKGNE